jgi:predicted ribosome quality control (RQC) complex YloA/Tae2 family protein
VQNNYYFLRQISEVLGKQLIGFQLIASFSQVKDELMFFFYSQDLKKEFFIRASLSPSFTCLSFPPSFARAKQNSVDLFEQIIGNEVIGVRQYLNERCFSIHFDNQKTLLFKMYGQMANVILFDEMDVATSSDSVEAKIKSSQAIVLFNNHLEKDWAIKLEYLDRFIDQSFEGFIANGLTKTFPTFDKNIKKELPPKVTPREEWQALQGVLMCLKSNTYYLNQENFNITFSLFPSPAAKVFTDPIAAINEFYHLYISKFQLLKEKNDALKKLEKEKEKRILYIQKSEEKLIELEIENRYEEFANILMANLHEIPEKVQKVTLHDFYHNKEITIKLKDNFSPQRNAEIYYRKGKNQKIEMQTLTENIEKRKTEFAKIKNQLFDIQKIDGLKELRKYLKTNGFGEENEEKEEAPFRRYDHEGFEILVGKNAKNNDLLTQKYAFKEDLWLHARDVTGSHVIIKYKAGKPFPSTVIARAAELAAWFSKRKNDSLCPVIYTPKKYVRKPKGSAEGAVVLEKEQVLMVEPKL